MIQISISTKPKLCIKDYYSQFYNINVFYEFSYVPKINLIIRFCFIIVSSLIIFSRLTRHKSASANFLFCCSSILRCIQWARFKRKLTCHAWWKTIEFVLHKIDQPLEYHSLIFQNHRYPGVQHVQVILSLPLIKPLHRRIIFYMFTYSNFY